MPDRTHGEVTELLEQRRTSVFGTLHREMAHDEAFITGTDVWDSNAMDGYMRAFPRDYKAKLVALARLAMLGAALSVNNGETPKVEVHIDKLSGISNYKETEALIQKCGRAFLASIREELWTVAKHQSGLGPAILYYGVDKSRLPEKPDDPKEMRTYELAMRDANCVDVRAMHPRRAMWDRDHTMPKDWMFEEEITPAAANDLYPDYGPWSATDQTKTLKRVIYVSAEQYGIWVDGTSVVKGAGDDGMAPNPYHRMWVSWAFSGLGFSGFDDNAVHEIQGVVRQSRGIFTAALTAFNENLILGATGAMPGRNYSGGTREERERVMAESETGPLAQNDMGGLDTGGAVQENIQEQVQRPQFTRDVQQQLSDYMNLMHGKDFMRGIPTVNNATVNAQNEALANSMFGPARAAFNAMAADCFTTVLHMLKISLESGQTVYWKDAQAEDGYIGLRADQIPERGMVISVDMTAPSMTERQANLANDMELMQTLGFSPEWLAGRQGIDNYAAERKTGVKNKLFEATADVAAEIMGQTLREMIPERLDISREADVRRGVVTPGQPPEQQQRSMGLPAGVGY